MKAPVFRSLVSVVMLLGWMWSAEVTALAQDRRVAANRGSRRPAVRNTETRRRAMELLGQAELALEAGQRGRAISLANEARKLYPQSKAIGGFLQAVGSSSKTPAPSAAFTRAKAHLAAALSRAQMLMGQRRYTEALDLLGGIIEASKMFPPESDAALYLDLARRELAEYREGVRAGRIRPSSESAPSSFGSQVSIARPPVAEFPAGPANAYRLARIAGQQTPAWFTRIKTRLRRQMSVDYHAMPLGLVLDDIEQVAGLSIIVDKPLQAARTTLTAVVDLRISSVPAETILALATQVAGCEYVLLEKGIVITTQGKAGDYIRQLPNVVSNQWAQARFLFPDLYLEAMASRPLPEAGPGQVAGTRELETVQPYLRSGKDLLGDIERIIQ